MRSPHFEAGVLFEPFLSPLNRSKRPMNEHPGSAAEVVNQRDGAASLPPSPSANDFALRAQRETPRVTCGSTPFSPRDGAAYTRGTARRTTSLFLACT